MHATKSSHGNTAEQPEAAMGMFVSHVVFTVHATS